MLSTVAVPAAKEFPIFERKPWETVAMVKARWEEEHKNLATRQHEYLHYIPAKAFDIVIQGDNLGLPKDRVVHYLRIALEKIFNPLIAEFKLREANFNAIHNGTGYEVTITYSVAGTNHHRLHITNLSPSEYASLV